MTVKQKLKQKQKKQRQSDNFDDGCHLKEVGVFSTEIKQDECITDRGYSLHPLLLC